MFDVSFEAFMVLEDSRDQEGWRHPRTIPNREGTFVLVKFPDEWKQRPVVDQVVLENGHHHLAKTPIQNVAAWKPIRREAEQGRGYREPGGLGGA